MGKKKDLKKVLDFFADYLKEGKNKKTKKVKEEKILLVETNEGVISKLKTPIDNFSVTAEHIKTLMDKVDAKTKTDANANSLLEKQRKEFNDLIKKQKDEFDDKLKKAKSEDEANTTIVVPEGFLDAKK
jgi:hypothetical protein